MHEKWCNQATSNNAEKQISFSNVSSEKDAEDFGAIAKFVVEHLITKVVQNEKVRMILSSN